jgi:streptomycin 6-kinase
MREYLEPYISKWRLSDPQPLAQTATSNLFKVQTESGSAVLKILSKVGAEDEKGAADVLLWYGGHGAIHLLNHDEGAMLLEYADGENLTTLVKDGKDDSATQVIVDILKRLHRENQNNAPKGLISLDHRFRSLFKKAEQDGHAGASTIFIRGAVVAHDLLLDQTPTYVLHGDIHHENIRYHSVRGWLAIDPKGLIGDRVYDAANALCNPNSLPNTVQNRDRLLRQAGIMSTGLNINRERLLSYVYVHACLWACWSLEDGEDPGYGVAMAKIAESCIKISS